MTFVYQPDGAESSAKAGGVLNGTRIALQPHLAVAGWPTDGGSRALAGYRALEDATMVERLRAAGARLCGYTRMSEFGLGLTDSGAGLALQRDAADAELVPDLMGEGRIAAARAAVFGFKPSYGALSRVGVVELMPSLQSCALLARAPQHMRALLQAVAGADPRDGSMPDARLASRDPRAADHAAVVLGVIQESCDTLTDKAAAAFAARVTALERNGVVIRRLSLPELPLFRLAYRLIGAVEASSCAGRYDSVRFGQRPPGARNWNEMFLHARGAAFGPLIKQLLFQGAAIQFEHYTAYEDACRIRARLVDAMSALTAQTDALLLPLPLDFADAGSSGLALCVAGFDAALFANVTGQPVVTLPPVEGMALQLAGARNRDFQLLDLAAGLFASGTGEEARHGG